jgi:hypothetical protein
MDQLTENVMSQQFNTALFEAGFNTAIEALGAAEKITKETLKVWANKVIEATHATGQTAYMNKLIAVLTPVNKKVSILFLGHFTGYRYDEKEMSFLNKDKKKYAQALIDWEKFSADPLNNIWVWADRHIEVAHKPFTLDDVSVKTSRIWKDAHAAGLTNGDIIRAMLSAKDKDKAVVFTLDDIVSALSELGVEGDLKVEDTSIFVRGDVSGLVSGDTPHEVAPL